MTNACENIKNQFAPIIHKRKYNFRGNQTACGKKPEEGTFPSWHWHKVTCKTCLSFNYESYYRKKIRLLEEENIRLEGVIANLIAERRRKEEE